MQLGILTAPFPDQDLLDVAAWAAGEGFGCLEVACWPAAGSEARRYAGTCHIDVEGLTQERASEVTGALAERGVSVSALGYYPNPLHPEAEHRERVVDHLIKVIDAAGLMGIPVVNTFVGGDRALHLEDNWAQAEALFPRIVAHARDRGVTLAFENCPMIFSRDEWPGGHNIACSPKVWRRLLEWDGVAMNFDPSHLIWQMIDVGRFIREFGSRMAHVHAKDLQIDRDGLYENGVLSLGVGWQVPRMPGLGEVDWPGVVSGLTREGYDGPVVIEHEDRAFEGSDEKVRRGFQLARDVLRPYVK